MPIATRSCRLPSATIIVAGLLASGIALAAPAPEALSGSWARRATACTTPELHFAADSATIRLDADGSASRFDYAGVRYRPAGSLITVALGARHPFAKTASKTELSFARIPDGTLDLQRKPPAASIRFVRCP